jgi:hypothetical protein
MRIVVLGALILMSVGCSKKQALPNGASFDPASGVFAWQGGEVKLPPDLKYEKIESDTFEGEFKSDSGRIVIEHDIGDAAGAWAQEANSVAFEERKVDGARVWVAQRSRQHGQRQEMLHVVTFPDNGCANFYMESNDVNMAKVIRGIADTFKPKNTAPPESGICMQRAKRESPQ